MNDEFRVAQTRRQIFAGLRPVSDWGEKCRQRTNGTKGEVQNDSQFGGVHLTDTVSALTQLLPKSSALMDRIHGYLYQDI